MYNPQDNEAQRFADWKAKREPQPQSQPQQTNDIQDDEAQRFADWKAKRKSTQARDNLVQNSYKFGNETVDSFIEDNLLRNDFALGSARNLLDYGASITKGVGKIGGKIGFDGFEQKAQRVSKRFNDKSHDVQDSIENKWVGMAGEMLGDPLNLTPAGIITKGTKAKRIAKSMLAGAGVGAGTMALKNYGDERLTQEQKNLEMGIGAGFVSAINGIIAGVTKGRVDGISPSALKNPDGTIKNDDDIANALMNEPEAFGLNKNEAEVITGEIVKHKQQKVLPQYAKETPFPKEPQEPNFQMRPNHPPAPMTKERALDVIFRKANQDAIAKGEQPIYPTVATDYEAHPRFNELIDMRRNVTAQQSQNPQVLDSRGGYREVSGNGGENKHAYDFPTYNQNHNYDFHLTANDIRNIEAGKINDDLRWKIKEDLNTMDNHPDWKKQSIDDIEMTDADWQEANAVFAKGVDNLAVGTYAGIEQDEQGNISFDPEKFIIGLGGYTAVKTALKNKKVQGVLKDYAQKAIEKVDMNPEVQKRGNSFNSMFVGAKGDEIGSFSDVASKKTMREIDDNSDRNIKGEERALIDNQSDVAHPFQSASNGSPRITYDQSPNKDTIIAQEAEKIKSTFDKNNPDMLMANGQTSLAGGFAGGSDALINQRDYDGDGEFTAKDLAYGAGAGVAGIHTLKKVAPKMFVDDAGEGGMKAGLFAGTKAKGYDAKAKARKTFNGKYDGMERFEINDSMSKLKNISDFVKSGETVRLDDVLEHKELFYNYPELKEIPIKFKKGEGSSFSKDGIEIGVDGFKSADDFKSALLHEVQHSLQKKEGFARGGSASEFYTDSKKKIDLLKYENEFEVDDFARDRRYKQIEQLEQKFVEGGKEEAFKMYQKLAGEIEARDVQARAGYTANKRDEIAPYSSEKVDPEDAVVRFNHENDELVRDLKQMSEMGDKKKKEKGVFKNSFDTLEELALNKDKKEWGDISKDNSTFKNVTNSMKELFTDTFNAKYHEARDLTHSNMQTKNLEVERLAKILGDLDEATDKELYRYLTGQDSTLPEGMKTVADKMRKTIDDLGAELVRNGVLEEKAFKEWAGVYLHRNYEPTMNPKGVFKKGFKIDKIHERGDSKTFAKDDLKGALGWLNKSGHIDFGEMGEIGNMRQLREYLNSSQKAGMLKEGKVSIIEQPDGKIKFRRDWTKAEREAMGELESAKYAVPETIMKLNRMTEHARFLKRAEGVKGVVLDGKMAKEMSHAEIERAGYTKLDGVSFGALNGKYVRADVADDVGRIYKDISNTHSDAFRVWNEYHGLWKKSKTVWNPTAHVNNYMGNLFLMHLSGVNSAKIPSLLKRGSQSMKAYKKFEGLEIKRLKGSLTDNEKLQYVKLKEQSKLVQEAKENGVFGRSQLNDILAGMENTVAKKGILSKIDRATERAYQLEDDFNRLSFYLTLRESGRDPQTSKKMIDFMLPDYSRPLPKGWRALRDTSIAPFISWSYYTMPSIVKMLGTKEGVKNATKVIGALSAMEYVMTQGDVTPLDNVPFMDGKKPEDFKGRRFAYGKNGDKIDTIKMDRMIPYAELQNPINYAKSNFSGMLPNAFYSMNGMQMYNGRPITYKNKDLGDKSVDWIKHLAGQYTPVPAPVMSGIGVADKAMRSKESRRRSKVIEPRTMPQSLMQILGLNTMTYSKDGLRKEQKD